MTKWCSSNEELSHKYVYDTTSEYHRTHNCSFSFEGNKLYSYTTQIASIDRKKKRIIMMQSYPTKTTTHHLYLLQRALPDDYIKVYSDCFIWKDLYKTFLKEIQKYYKQKYCKRKNNILSRKEDRFYLNTLKNNLNSINKYEYFKKHHKDLYDFVESNVKYESDRIEFIIKKNQKEKEEQQACIKEAIQSLENFLNSEDCEKMIENIIKRENVSDNNLINLIKLQRILQKDLGDYINVNGQLLKNKKININCSVLFYTLNNFIQKRLFNIPNRGQTCGYDIVYFDHNSLELKTTRSVTIQTNKNSLESIIKMIKIYLSGKHLDILVCKHVGPYMIRNANTDQIQIGCHTFHYNNIKLLYNELMQYEKEKTNENRETKRNREQPS